MFFFKKWRCFKGIYSSLNCGLGSNDKKENVLNNLDIVSKKMGIKNNLFTMNQTHSNKVVIMINNKNIQRINADALLQIKNIAISVLTADCVPILIYEEVNHIVLVFMLAGKVQ